MPFIDVAIRQALGLTTSTPSLEDIAAAAAARGLHFDPHSFTLAPAQSPSTPTKRSPKPKQPAAAIQAPADVLTQPTPPANA